MSIIRKKYEDIENFIKNYKNGYFSLSDFDIKDKNFIPKKLSEYKYIELSNIGNNGEVRDFANEFGENLPTRARRIVNSGGVIISSIEGSLGSCALISDDFDKSIVSTGFYVLKTEQIKSETLLVLFKTDFFQNYLKKFVSGTILTAISKDELKKVLIPKIPLNIQENISKNLQKSFELRKEAKKLLENAKQIVENSISRGGGW